jgi:transmembrane 9 superfamily protein 1
LFANGVVSGIAGFVSASLYRKLNGDSWVWNINITSALFAGQFSPRLFLFHRALCSVPVFLVWAVSNSLSWAYQSTQALPYTTVIIIFLIWLLGKRVSLFRHQCGGSLQLATR